MIRYYPNLLLTFTEIKNHPSLLIHGLTGCPFHCFHCFNYKDIVMNKGDDGKYYSIETLTDYIHKQKDLYEYLLFSGGEYLNASLEALIYDLRAVRGVSDKPIIIYTSGFAPEKMQRLLDLNLVDGFHLDMKLPFHLLTEEDYPLLSKVMGVKVGHQAVIDNFLKTLELVIATDKGYNKIRTVRYPFLDESAFEENRLYIQKLNEKHHKNLTYEVNPFLFVEDQA